MWEPGHFLKVVRILVKMRIYNHQNLSSTYKPQCLDRVQLNPKENPEGIILFIQSIPSHLSSPHFYLQFGEKVW